MLRKMHGIARQVWALTTLTAWMYQHMNQGLLPTRFFVYPGTVAGRRLSQQGGMLAYRQNRWMYTKRGQGALVRHHTGPNMATMAVEVVISLALAIERDVA